MSSEAVVLIHSFIILWLAKPSLGECSGQNNLPARSLLVPIHDTCFVIFWDRKLTWLDAASFCTNYNDGAILAKIPNAEVQISLERILNSDRKFRRKKFWIGLSDRAVETSYLWPDGTALGDFSNFYVRPRYMRVLDHYDCAYLDGRRSWQWDVRDCDNIRLKEYFICQLDFQEKTTQVHKTSTTVHHIEDLQTSLLGSHVMSSASKVSSSLTTLHGETTSHNDEYQSAVRTRITGLRYVDDSQQSVLNDLGTFGQTKQLMKLRTTSDSPTPDTFNDSLTSKLASTPRTVLSTSPYLSKTNKHQVSASSTTVALTSSEALRSSETVVSSLEKNNSSPSSTESESSRVTSVQNMRQAEHNDSSAPNVGASQETHVALTDATSPIGSLPVSDTFSVSNELKISATPNAIFTQSRPSRLSAPPRESSFDNTIRTVSQDASSVNVNATSAAITRGNNSTRMEHLLRRSSTYAAAIFLKLNTSIITPGYSNFTYRNIANSTISESTVHVTGNAITGSSGTSIYPDSSSAFTSTTQSSVDSLKQAPGRYTESSYTETHLPSLPSTYGKIRTSINSATSASVKTVESTVPSQMKISIVTIHKSLTPSSPGYSTDDRTRTSYGSGFSGYLMSIMSSQKSNIFTSFRNLSEPSRSITTSKYQENATGVPSMPYKTETKKKKVPTATLR